MNKDYFTKQGEVDRELVIRFLNQLNDILHLAYYSTPPHTSSKALIKRAKDITVSLLSVLES
ncbi:MAG: hypothetical protein J7L82_04795 [Staphylothermus sp.]|nr:hypothetical protein [Staphylothermus sp.]